MKKVLLLLMLLFTLLFQPKSKDGSLASGPAGSAGAGTSGTPPVKVKPSVTKIEVADTILYYYYCYYTTTAT